MEQIFDFKYEIIKTKKDEQFIKTLLLTFDENDNFNAYTSFSKFEGTINTMISTPDFSKSLSLKDVIFAGRVGYDSRFSVLIEYLNVDGVSQIASLIYTKVY